MADDVSVKFGADLTDLQDGAKAAGGVINDNLIPSINSIGALAPRQIGSAITLMQRLATTAGIAVGPIGAIGLEIVRAAQHFDEFDSAATAFESIGITLFEALTSKVTIALGAIVALGIGVKLAFDAMSGPSAQQVQDELKAISDVVKEIGDRWKDAGESAQAALAKTDEAIQRDMIASLQQAEAVLKVEIARIADNMSGGVQGALAQVISEQLNAGASSATITMLRNFSVDAAQGKLDILALRDALDKLGVANAADVKLNALITLIEGLSKNAITAASDIRALDAAGQVTGTQPSVGTLQTGYTGFADEDKAAAAADLKKQLDALGTAASKAAKPFDEATASLQKETVAIQAQVDSFGMSTQASATYIKAQETINDLHNQGVALTAGQVAEINKEAAAYGVASAKLDDLKKAQQAASDQLKVFQGYATTFVNGLDSALSGLILKTQNFRQAVLSVLAGMAQDFIKNEEAMVAKWIAGEAQKTAATVTGASARTAAEASAAATTGTLGVAGLLKSIFADAAKVFGGVFAFLAPALGPAAAGPAAASEAAVMSVASSVPSLDVGSWSLPSDMFAMVHKGEMIVPAQGGMADMMRTMLGGGGAGGGPGGGTDMIAQLAKALIPHFRQMSGSSNRLSNTVANALKRMR